MKRRLQFLPRTADCSCLVEGHYFLFSRQGVETPAACFLFSPTFQWKSPHLINSSVCLSVTMFDQIFLYQLLRLFCFVVSFQTPILENGMVRMGIFVANGTSRFCTKGRRPLVFRMPIRNVPFVFSKSDTWFRRNYA